MKRTSVEEAKSYWFNGDLTIYIKSVPVGHGVVALPAREVASGASYMRELQRCATLGEVEQVYLRFQADPKAPRIVPQIFHPIEGRDFDEHFINEYLVSRGIGLSEFDHFMERLIITELGAHFVGSGDSFELEGDFETFMASANPETISYTWDRAEVESYQGLDHWVLWTNAWVPTEIVATLGMQSDQYLDVDGNPAFIFANIEKFVAEFEKSGFTFIYDNPDFLELIGNTHS